MSRSGEAPIFARLTISGQRAEFNINRSVDPDNWNAAKGLSKGKSKRDLELNKYLDSIRVRISEIHTMLVKEEEVINPNVIKQHFLGKAEGPKMLVEVFNYVNVQHKERFDRVLNQVGHRRGNGIVAVAGESEETEHRRILCLTDEVGDERFEGGCPFLTRN